METIQVVLDKKLLQAANRAAKQAKQNRSALIREALRQHLHKLEMRAKEERDREGYRKVPQTKEELREVELFAQEAAWPEP